MKYNDGSSLELAHVALEDSNVKYSTISYARVRTRHRAEGGQVAE